MPGRLRDNAADWLTVLRGDPDVRTRRRPGVWSVLEYACHVRDALRLGDQRISLMVAEQDPTFANWDQDATAMADRYSSQDPAAVASDLHRAAVTVAERLETLADDGWPRTGSRSDGAIFTVETFARYLLHDPIHHLHDVGYHRFT